MVSNAFKFLFGKAVTPARPSSCASVELSATAPPCQKSQIGGRFHPVREPSGESQNETSRRLATIPGIGFLTASAIAATVLDPSFFKSGREFAAWLGLTPRQNSSGNKQRLGRISKKGNAYIRRLLVAGATSMLRYARLKTAAGADWVNGLLKRRPARLVTVAMANKTARISWAVMEFDRFARVTRQYDANRSKRVHTRRK